MFCPAPHQWAALKHPGRDESRKAGVTRHNRLVERLLGSEGGPQKGSDPPCSRIP